MIITEKNDNGKSWKLSVTIPIFEKSEKKKNPGNYKFIVLLNSLMKTVCNILKSMPEDINQYIRQRIREEK